MGDLTGCREGGVERCYRKLCARNTAEAEELFVDIKKVFINNPGLLTPRVLSPGRYLYVRDLNESH